MKRIKRFDYFVNEASDEDIDLETEDEQDEISFSNEEVKILEGEGFERAGELRFRFPGIDVVNIEISKNENEEGIYYRVIIEGFGMGKNPVNLYRKKFKTIESAMDGLNRDIDKVIFNLAGITNILGAW